MPWVLIAPLEGTSLALDRATRVTLDPPVCAGGDVWATAVLVADEEGMWLATGSGHRTLPAALT